jgi:deoxyribodipyrimidine photolyase-related protein
MVAGNFALLTGFDAVEWVEKPNTRGMSQFADGGIIATKPYVSSTRYIHSMSDYCNACHYDWSRRHGENACPFNSLYWEFLMRHRSLLAPNPRMGLVYRTLNRMDRVEFTSVMRQAEYCRSHLEKL